MTNTGMTVTASKRLMSIDALRGFDMLWIIGGSEVIIAIAKACPNTFFLWLSKNFDHEWGRFRFYDLIMPFSRKDAQKHRSTKRCLPE